jgi:hypothetical protein
VVVVVVEFLEFYQVQVEQVLMLMVVGFKVGRLGTFLAHLLVAVLAAQMVTLEKALAVVAQEVLVKQAETQHLQKVQLVQAAEHLMALVLVATVEIIIQVIPSMLCL